jgi:hypothetical protein
MKKPMEIVLHEECGIFTVKYEDGSNDPGGNSACHVYEFEFENEPEFEIKDGKVILRIIGTWENMAFLSLMEKLAKMLPHDL